jgi:SAM-dependent methyltransferase
MGKKTKGYLHALDGPYHQNRLRMVKALIEEIDFTDSVCLDFGCGDGVFAEMLLTAGAKHVHGIDIAEEMITSARERLNPFAERVTLEVGGVERLSNLPDRKFDHTFSLNVNAYFSQEDDACFYKQARRIMLPGGSLVITHSNELFDMFTLNRYTKLFFEKHFSMEGAACDVSPLLTRPDVPSRRIFGVRENPLSYPEKLRKLGFDPMAQEFAILHSMPPLLTPEINFDDINARFYPETLGWDKEDKWKLAFMCSIFGSRGVAQ